MKKFRHVIAVLGILLILPMGAVASDKTMSEEQIKTIVKEVIKQNPELIQTTLNEYRAEQKKILQEKQFEAMFKNRVDDTVPSLNPQKGDANAAVTIIEYTDFQCPYCSKGAQSLKQAQDRYPDKVRVVFKNLPLKMHAQALPAAKAALAAHKQDKFWEYHDLLFNNQRRLNEDAFIKMAQSLNLDMEKFNADRNSKAVEQQITADLDQARKLGITGTPRFLVNGVQIKGAYPPDYFAKVIDRLLQENI